MRCKGRLWKPAQILIGRLNRHFVHIERRHLSTPAWKTKTSSFFQDNHTVSVAELIEKLQFRGHSVPWRGQMDSVIHHQRVEPQQKSFSLAIFSQQFDQIVAKQDQKIARRGRPLPYPRGCCDDGRVGDAASIVIYSDQSCQQHRAAPKWLSGRDLRLC